MKSLVWKITAFGLLSPALLIGCACDSAKTQRQVENAKDYCENRGYKWTTNIDSTHQNGTRVYTVHCKTPYGWEEAKYD